MKKRRGLADRGYSRRSRNCILPALERVEDRVLMAVFTVSVTSDTLNDTATSNNGELRWAILASNATTTANTIDFMLPGGVQTISLKSALPAITKSLLIDGSTAVGFLQTPLIQISGLTANGDIAGPAISVNAAGSELRDLIVNNFTGNAIELNGGTSTVDGCWIGIDSTGTKAASNSDDGIYVSSAGNTIGGSFNNPNVIAGNAGNDIEIVGAGAGGNTVAHNYIGTNASGTAAINAIIPGVGIAVSTANNIIGGSTFSGFGGGGNLISGAQEGLVLYTGASGNQVEGNFIGTDATGNAPLGNIDFGIYVSGGQNNTIGGITGSVANVISGNGNDGIRIQGANSILNQIQGNQIGVGADGISAVGNTNWGVQINGASNNVVGGTIFQGIDPTFGNTIENNGTSSKAGGVLVVLGTGDGILSNDIYQNNGPGIQLTNGGNQGVRAPIITSAQSGAGRTRIIGTISGNPNTQYRIQYFSSQSANPLGTGDGQFYQLGDLDVFTNRLGVASISTTLFPNVPVGNFVTATATQGVIVTNNTSAFSTAVVATQAAVTDLSVTTAIPTGGPLLDQNYTYTLTVANGGPNDATGVVLTDTLPANATLVSSSQGTVTGGVLTDNIGPLASGATDVITLVVKPIAIGKFVNVANVTGNEVDSDTTNNTSSTATASGPVVAPDSDLQVSLTPSTTLTPVGSPITYTLSIGNSGPSTATGTMVTVQFPADFSNLVVMPDQGGYTINADNSVTINTGIVPASSATNITLIATPTAVESAAVVMASVISNVLDPNPANNSASSTVVVANAADLGVSISANPNPVLIGQELFYTVVVTNNGPSAATSPAIVDLLPNGQTYDPINSNAGGNGSISESAGTVTASLNALAAGGSDTITIAVTVATPGEFTNAVTVGDPGVTNPIEIDPDPTNNVAATTVQVSPADLSVTVVNPNDPLFIGTDEVFQVQVANNGPATATNVILNDVFSGVAGSIVATSVGSGSGTSFNADLGSLASGQMVQVSIIFDPTSSGTLIDQAGVTSDEFDPDPNNNTSSTSNMVSPADLSVSMTSVNSQVLIGQNEVFIVTVTNNGPATATNVLFNDLYPAGAILVAIASSQGSVAPEDTFPIVSGNLGSLAPGASATVTIALLPLATGTTTNTAGVASDNLDPSPDNNSATLSIGVINLPGTIQAASSVQYVAENAGSVTLTIDRVGGSAGTVTANYATSDYTAIAGVNYVKTSGTVTFLDGQTTATITIPVLHDFIIDGNLGFFVNLSSPTGGASIGSPASIGVVVLNVDRDNIPPVISSLLAIPAGNQLTGFALTFDKAMDPTLASLVSNYHVFLEGANGSLSVVPLAAAEYVASNTTVLLVPTSPVPANRFYRIIANGTVANALTDTSGNVLSGDNGQYSNYDVVYGQGTKLVYDDAQNNVVTLNLTGGGNMGVYLQPNGEASLINLYGIVPHSSKLSGSVKKLNKHGSGHTYVGEINGFGQFGNVRSTLTTPSFYVGSAVVAASSVGAGVPVPLTVSTGSGSAGSVSAESIPLTVSVDSETTPVLITNKVTPKGPAYGKR